MAAVEEEIQQMEAEEAERRVRQSAMDSAKLREAEVNSGAESFVSNYVALDNINQKRESFLNPIPELNIIGPDRQNKNN